MNSVSSTLTLTKICNSCATPSSIDIKLGDILNNLSKEIDKKFTKNITHESFSCVCDIPTIATEYSFYEDNSLLSNDGIAVNNVTNYIVSHIHNIEIYDNNTFFNNLSPSDKRKVYQSLPTSLTTLIENEFVLPIHKTLSNIDFLKMHCNKCKESFSLNIEIKNINELIRIIFKDNTLIKILMDIFNLSISGHVDANFLMTLAPYELNNMLEYLKESNTPKDNSRKDTNLFEGPSEFTGM